MRVKSVLERLTAKSRMEGECLVWTGNKNRGGYGRIRISSLRSRKLELAHRAAWTARHGAPPAETPFVLHHCDNPPCFLDEHLFLGTQADNMADKQRKGRAYQYHCEDAPGAKLSNVQVIEIKRRLAAGESQRSIARSYAVSHVAIGHIKRGRNFIEVPWPSEIERV